MSKTITYLDIRQKTPCSTCGGTGEVLVYDKETSTPTEHEMIFFVCHDCKGKKYKMERRTISLESFKGLKN